MNARTLFITRDSDCFGNLSKSVDVWEDRPIRAKLTVDAGYVWLPAEAEGLAGRTTSELGLVKNLPARYALERYGCIPETDRECIRVMVVDE